MTNILVQTERLQMRPMTEADAPDFHALVTRPEVARMLYLFPTDWTLPEAVDFLDLWAWRGQLGFRLALICDGAWAGWIGASGDDQPEIFYALRPEYAGRGLAREAVAGFSAFLFDRFAPGCVTAGVFCDNPASARVLQVCGFEWMASQMHHSRGRLAPAPAQVYRLCSPLLAVSK